MLGIGTKRSLEDELAALAESEPGTLQLEHASQVAVVGGGPAGSFAAYFLLDMAERVEMGIHVDIFEPKNYSRPGPGSCNHCGGIVSESLVQFLAADGINLPSTVVQRGIDSYVLHMDAGSVRIETPLHEKRIAAVHRGGGPRGSKEMKWRSFDGYLQTLAVEKGANVIRDRVVSVRPQGDRPEVKTRTGLSKPYDLVVGAVGINSGGPRLFEGLSSRHRPPRTTRTCICELRLGEETVERCIGSSMHVFLLNLPRLEFAALIPKGDYVTACMLGEEIDDELVQGFLNSPEVKRCLPSNWEIPEDCCRCQPRISVHGAVEPFGDRIVLIGDCGVTRLYKDGIGAAYRTAKAVATTAIFEGVSADAFRSYYWPTCKAIAFDNKVGQIVFAVTRQIQKRSLGRRTILRMAAAEQGIEGKQRRMSTVLWDTFTGSAPYKEILLRTLHPAYVFRLLWHMAMVCLTAMLPSSFLSARGRPKIM